jgi:phosphatidylserine decarboxylase
MALILVGAMIVGSIETVWAGPVNSRQGKIQSVLYDTRTQPALTLEKGIEMGRFKLGSTVIVLFGPHRVRWSPTVLLNRRLRMGELLALPHHA